MNAQFLLAQPSDQEIVLNLMSDFYAIDGYPFDRNKSQKNYQALLANESLGRLWLIKNDNNVIGYLVLAFGFSFEYGGRDAFIDELYLKEEYRGKGLGEQTIDFVNQEAKSLGIKALHLEVERHNERGNQLYRKKGFGGAERTLLTKWL
uniref:GNAT family N-acetyltransferase n=1 Tax=Roseihalotalea indica TaxID=2867963 RepID=A0AA49GTM6_9BACT|nr:GNAT family N-acetyltransferase [Tunicatimonas sp. TK19036]